MTTTISNTPGGIFDKGSWLIYVNKGVRLDGDSPLLARHAQFVEHFFGLAIDATNGIVQSHSTGTTGSDIPFAIVANGIGGTAQVATGTDANAGAIVSGPISFIPSTQATKRPIWMEARMKVDGTTTPTDGDFYVGFGDARTYTNDLPYVISAAGATTTGVPTEGAFISYTSVTQTSGPVFDATGDGTLFGLTSKTGTDSVTALKPAFTKDSNYHIYRVEIDINGNVAFFVDDKFMGVAGAAITAATALSPQVSIVTKASHVNTLTIDYIAAGAGTI